MLATRFCTLALGALCAAGGVCSAAASPALGAAEAAAAAAAGAPIDANDEELSFLQATVEQQSRSERRKAAADAESRRKAKAQRSASAREEIACEANMGQKADAPSVFGQRGQARPAVVQATTAGWSRLQKSAVLSRMVLEEDEEDL